MAADKPHHDLLKLGSSVAIAPKFEELTQDLGQKLLSPLKNRCFDYNEDIWLYKFCVGEKVEQFHVEPNGSYSEEFALGQSKLGEQMDANRTVDDSIEDDSINNLILFGTNGKKEPYLVIDTKSNGYVVRIFNNQDSST